MQDLKPNSIEDELKYSPKWAKILPDIEYFNLPEEIVSIIKEAKKLIGDYKYTHKGTLKQTESKQGERMGVLLDLDVYNRPFYSDHDVRDADNTWRERMYYYYPAGSFYCSYLNLKPYLFIDHNKKIYPPITAEDLKKTDRTIYYQDDGHIFLSQELAELLKIVDIDRLKEVLEQKETEKPKVYAKTDNKNM